MNSDLQNRLALHKRKLEISNALLSTQEIQKILKENNILYDMYFHGFPELNKGQVDSCPINQKLSASALEFTAAGFVNWNRNLHKTISIDAGEVMNQISAAVASNIQLPRTVEIASDDLQYQLTISWEDFVLVYHLLRIIIPVPVILIDSTLLWVDDGTSLKFINKLN